MVITFASCEKERYVLESNTNSKTTTKNPPSQFEKANNMAVSTWFDHGGTNFGCSGSPTNCLEEVIITANLAEVITDFANSDNQGEFASHHYATLKEVIDESLLDNVVLSDNTVRLKGSISSSSTGYLVFLDGTSTKMVYPFRK